MKPFLAYSSLLILLLAAKCEEPTSPCIDESKINPTGICTMDYSPVCGCDENTYGNACQAKNAGLTSWEKGECK